jgi:hypothetical protein
MSVTDAGQGGAAGGRVMVRVDGAVRVAAVRRVRHQRDAECLGCLNVARLLMPVRVHTPYGAGAMHLCLKCRIGWRDDQWACLASTVEHSARRAALNPHPDKP